MARKRIKRKGDNLVRDGLIICAVAAVLALILGGVYLRTKSRIDKASDAAKLTAFQNVFEGYEDIEFKEDEALDKGISEYNKKNSAAMKATIDSISVAVDSQGSTKGYAFIAHSAGYSGNITIAAGVDADGDVTGIDIVYMNEMAGLGDACTDDSFKDQFKGKSGKIGIRKSGSAADGDTGESEAEADNEIDGLSHATVTSEAVVNAVNICLDYFASAL